MYIQAQPATPCRSAPEGIPTYRQKPARVSAMCCSGELLLAAASRVALP